MHSEVTDNFQTTIPIEVREKLKLTASDSIEWDISEEGIRIRRNDNPLSNFMGFIKVGSGSVENDISAAQENRLEKSKK